MHISFDVTTGIITIGYIKCTLDALISYISVLIGFAAHIYKLGKLTAEQAAANKLKADELAELRRTMRKDFIRDYAGVYYTKVEAAAKATETEIDDKLLYYLRMMSSAFYDVIGSEPTEVEIAKMKDIATAMAFKDTHSEESSEEDDSLLKDDE